MAPLNESGDSLTGRVLHYQKTGQGLDELLGDLSEEIYFYPNKKRMSKEDDAGNFYLYFIPRLKRLLLRYRDQGVPFEHYFHSALCWNLKSYYHCSRRKAWDWWISACPELWEPLTQSPEVEDELTSLRKGGFLEGRTAKRCVLFLALRNVRDLDDRGIEVVCEITGVDREWLRERVRNLRESIGEREKRLELLRNRRNSAFYRCKILENRLGGQPDGDERERLQQKIVRLRKIRARIMEEMARVPLAPTHRAIAEVLGIPKGTVDTGLRWIKQKLLYSLELMKYA